MERKQFLRNSLSVLGFAALAPLVKACRKDSTITSGSGTSTNSDSTSASGTGTSATSGSCTVTPTEEAGPFPTKTPASLVTNDITSDRTGVPFTINITVHNSNGKCAALEGAIVDIWHCDKDGNYSEYGGGGMQGADYTGVNFLRGRQTTDSNGLVTYKSIFPGWYSGRAPHVHVHIYSAGGTSLLVTQIAFPTDVCNTVYTTSPLYAARGTQDTSNTQDHVFADSLATELATVTGSVANGYTMNHSITVAA